MSNTPMLQFVHRAKAMPTKRGAERRRHDFDEIYDEFNASRRHRASRTMLAMRGSFLPNSLPTP